MGNFRGGRCIQNSFKVTMEEALTLPKWKIL